MLLRRRVDEKTSVIDGGVVGWWDEGGCKIVGSWSLESRSVKMGSGFRTLMAVSVTTADVGHVSFSILCGVMHLEAREDNSLIRQNHRWLPTIFQQDDLLIFPTVFQAAPTHATFCPQSRRFLESQA